MWLNPTLIVLTIIGIGICVGLIALDAGRNIDEVDISFIADKLYIASKFYPIDDHLPPRSVVIDLEPWFPDAPLEGHEPLGQLRSLVQSERTKGNNVVLMCRAGRNRSALIAAMVLIQDGIPPDEAIAQIRVARTTLHRRGGALTNESFVSYLTYRT
jgi:hypothetical protein